MAPTESAEFAAAAGSASSVDERTLRTLLMRQPAAKELGLTDDALMDSFVRSCAVSSKPSPDSPSSVVSPGPRARYTCAQYLRVVADLSQYRHDVRLGTLLVGNGRSVLQNNAGGLVDNYGAVVRFNDYQTEGRPPALIANPRRHPSPPDPAALHTLSSPPHPIQPVHLLPCRLPICLILFCDSVVVTSPPCPSLHPPPHTLCGWCLAVPPCFIQCRHPHPCASPHPRLRQARWHEDDPVGAERLGTHRAHPHVPWLEP